MIIKQISVFVENKSGRLAEITKILADNGVDIRALSLADTTKFGILRFIVDEPERAEKALRDAELTVSITDVIAVSVEDQPGGLAYPLRVLNEKGINVEYIYAFVGAPHDKAFVILHVDDNQRAVEELAACGIPLLCTKDIMKI
ncbi:MAG: ACT domain-containing protein [Oscillospiraceae bacterium]|jgi:hypothetical protein